METSKQNWDLITEPGSQGWTGYRDYVQGLRLLSDEVLTGGDFTSHVPETSFRQNVSLDPYWQVMKTLEPVLRIGEC